MASVAAKLTVAEFERQYGQEKPHYEYWHGEAVQKSVPTVLHSLIQRILLILLTEAGYEAYPEVKPKINPNFQPVPDIIASRSRLDARYPTKPVEVVIEILSEEDPMSRVLAKCRAYDEWGFGQVYIVDPLNREVLRWHEKRLETTDTLAGVTVDAIWTRLEPSLTRTPE